MGCRRGECSGSLLLLALLLLLLQKQLWRRPVRFLPDHLGDLPDQGGAEPDNSELDEVLQNERAEAAKEPRRPLLPKYRDETICESLVLGENGYDLAAGGVQVVDECAAALEVEAVQDRLDGEEEDIGRQVPEQRGQLVLVLSDAGEGAAIL